MSVVATFHTADYPLYKIDVQLSTGQVFTYFTAFQSGLANNVDDTVVLAVARMLKSADWGVPAGLPAGTVATSVTLTRAVEQTTVRVMP